MPRMGEEWKREGVQALAARTMYVAGRAIGALVEESVYVTPMTRRVSLVPAPEEEDEVAHSMAVLLTFPMTRTVPRSCASSSMLVVCAHLRDVAVQLQGFVSDACAHYSRYSVILLLLQVAPEARH